LLVEHSIPSVSTSPQVWEAEIEQFCVIIRYLLCMPNTAGHSVKP